MRVLLFEKALVPSRAAPCAEVQRAPQEMCTPSAFCQSRTLSCRRLDARNKRRCKASFGAEQQLTLHEQRDLEMLSRAAKVSLGSLGLTHPHPNHGCVLMSASGQVITEAFLRAQGAPSAEHLACDVAREAARGGTAYLNLETGDCHGDTSALEALLRVGVRRVVVGMRNPLPHMRGGGVALLRANGVDVVVLEDQPIAQDTNSAQHRVLRECLLANEPLLHRAALKRPMSILKYAMTLDGKIATHTGHSAWVSNASSRARVFQMRATSDVVIVGGQTVRRDNPRLTTRRDSGHQPARIVMSRTLDLPKDANLWDTTTAPTIVMTQQGARTDFQKLLEAKGVEVVQFDFLTPSNVADYCFERGFMQCFWECGGTLAAPAISSGTIHKVMSFVAPKIIGGTHAPTPVGNLGFVEMTQAVNLVDVEYDVVDGDLLITGALPSSGGIAHLHELVSTRKERAQAPKQLLRSVLRPVRENGARAGAALGPLDAPVHRMEGSGGLSSVHISPQPATAEFYKAWDQWGCLSNFSPHPIDMPYGKAPLPAGPAGPVGAPQCRWPSVEHYYQAQKFWRHGDDAAARSDPRHDVCTRIIDAILAAESPEEAARIGRYHQHMQPELVRDDWAEAKVGVMLQALRKKFQTHAGPQGMLLSTVGGGGAGDTALELIEASPHDYFWGRGRDGTGKNMLGQLLMRVREELTQGGEGAQPAGSAALRGDQLETAV